VVFAHDAVSALAAYTLISNVKQELSDITLILDLCEQLYTVLLATTPADIIQYANKIEEERAKLHTKFLRFFIKKLFCHEIILYENMNVRVTLKYEYLSLIQMLYKYCVFTKHNILNVNLF
jgi:hypothetical protein